jgi:hypothetical protein
MNKQLIKDHVLSIIDFSEYDNIENTPGNVLDTMQKEYSHMLTYYAESKVFAEWCKGLPTCFNCLYWDDEIAQFLYDAELPVNEDSFINIELYLNTLYLTLKELKNQ